MAEEKKIGAIKEELQAAEDSMLPDFIARYEKDERSGVKSLVEKAGKRIQKLEAEYARVAEKYGMEVDKVKPLIPADSLITDLKVKKAMDLVKANTVAPAAKPADAADAE